jgi:hypothetical protein
MPVLLILNLILFLIVPFGVLRSGRPWTLVLLYIFLAVAASAGVFFYAVHVSDFIGNIVDAGFTASQGDPIGAARVSFYLITVFTVGNLIALVCIFLLGGWMAARRQREGVTG